MWSVFQIQDILGMSEDTRRKNPADERINVPSDPKHYWQYRMHINLEQLVDATEFNDELKQYIYSSGRG
jgi:4-alpha-glucanotransferase